jgi:hypothetical protein
MSRLPSGRWIVPAALLSLAAYALVFAYVAQRVTQGLV